MRHIFFPVLVGSLLMTLSALHPASATEPVSLKNLARQPALQSISMSPDGEHLVGLIPSPTNPKETALAVWDTDSLSSGPQVVTPSGDHMKFIAATALKAGKILAVARQEWTGQLGGCGEGKMTGATRTFVTKTYLTGLKQKDFEEAFANQRRRTGVSQRTLTCRNLNITAGLVDMLPLDPDKVIVNRSSGFSLFGNYYLYDLKTGKTELLYRSTPSKTPALFDSRTGKVLVKTHIEQVEDDYQQEVFILDPDTGEFVLQKPLTTQLSDRHSVSVVGRSEETGKYYVLTDQFSDQVQVRLYDPETHKYDSKPVLAVDNFSIGGLIFGTKPVNFNKVVGYVVSGPYSSQHYITPNLKAIHSGLKKAFPGLHVYITDYTNDFSKVLFTTQDNSHPPAYHLLLDGKKVVNLGSSRPWVKPERIGEERWVTYEARDGMTIPAILDLPAGWDKGDKPLAAIVLPHGGPWARDHMGWSATGWIPMLTSRGYAVLRPQYRGSSGLGRELWLAGDAQWGLTMSDDLDDGAKWLVKQGIADDDRIAIFGYSYGGFAAIAADVRNPSPFQCAISGAPVADLGRLGTSWSSNRLQRILQGHTVKGMDPMQNTKQAHLPILIFDGNRDVRTPRAIHAEPFYEAVKDQVHAEYHEIPDMPHSMPWYPRQKMKTMHLILGFLKDHCDMPPVNVSKVSQTEPARTEPGKSEPGKADASMDAAAAVES